MSEVERVRQQRGRDIQTLIARISRSMMIPSKQRGVWITTMLHRVQDVVGTLVETTNLLNSIEEVHAALNSGETREFFEVRTNRFNIKQDVNIEGEAFSMVDNLFECVKSTVQDKWSMLREWGYEEDDRAKQIELWLDRPTENRKQVGLNRPTSAQVQHELGLDGSSVQPDGYQFELGLDGSTHQRRLKLGPDGSINQVQHELGLDGSSVQTSARKSKQSKLRRDGQIYSFLYEIENTVQTQDLRWTWDVWMSKVLEVVDRSVDHTMQSIGKQCQIDSSIDIEHEISDHDLLEMYLEHEAGVKLKRECRESRDKIENIIKELLKDKAMKGQLTDTARQSAYVNSLEDATRFQQRMMMTVNRQTSGLRTEEEVIKSLREQKTIQFIHLNTAKMIKDNSNEQDTNRLYSEQDESRCLSKIRLQKERVKSVRVSKRCARKDRRHCTHTSSSVV
jgi:hypothetical protein